MAVARWKILVAQRENAMKSTIWGLAYAKDSRNSWDPFSAFRYYQSEIANSLSTDMQFSTAENIQEAVTQLKGKNPNVLFVCPRWDTGCEEAENLINALRAAGSAKKIAFVDHCDATSTPYLPLLTDVDLFIKPTPFRDTRMYLREYVGGYIFTEFLVKNLGWEINGWHFGSCAKKEDLGKLRVGWNYGVSRRYYALAKFSSLLRVPWALRKTDVNRRFAPVKRGTEEWYERYRYTASEAIEKLGGRVKISGYERIKFERYHFELMTSKIVFSPFGWGEVCFRDFETIACGALLMKPDMTHVQTKPDIFRANETYIPVKWDFSDLAEKVDYYLSHPHEAKRIAYAGQQCFLNYFKQKQFLKEFNGLLNELNPSRA